MYAVGTGETGGGVTDTIVVRDASAEDAPAVPIAAPTPIVVTTAPTKQARAIQAFMAHARGWTVTGQSRHLSRGVGVRRAFL